MRISKIYTHDYPMNTQMKIIKAIVLLILSITLIHCSSEEMPKPSFGGPSDGDGTPSKQYLKEFAAFPVGNIVSASKLASNSEDNLKFKEILLNDYNSITAENDMKMANIFRGPDNYDWSDGDAIVAYAKANGLRVHGHALVWHSSIPGWLTNFAGTDEEFSKLIENYIKQTVAHFAEEKDSLGNSVVASWDVLNEYFDGTSVRSSLFSQRMGADFHKKLFQWAREANSDVKLFYNDYNVIGISSKRSAILSMVSDFQSNNIPIDGIGAQVHINYQWPTITDIQNGFQEIANTGLLIHSSELDITVNPNDDISELTAERAISQSVQFQRLAFYYGEIVPKNQQFGITVWGFRDQDSWIYEGGTDWPLLYDNNFEPKPAYDGFRNGLDGQAP